MAEFGDYKNFRPTKKMSIARETDEVCLTNDLQRVRRAAARETRDARVIETARAE